MPSKISSQNWTFLSHPYSKTSLPLGTLVHSTSTPDSSYLIAIAPKSDLESFRRDDPEIMEHGISHIPSSLKPHIASVFLGQDAVTDIVGKKLEMKAHHGFIYQLWSPSAWFVREAEKVEVRRWLEDGWRERKRTWMVVGLKTLVDADLVTGRSDFRDKVQGDNEEEQEEWEFPGERIYAIRYARVDMRFFESWECAPVRGTRWESHSSVLGGEGELEIVEAYLEEVEEAFADGH